MENGPPHRVPIAVADDHGKHAAKLTPFHTVFSTTDRLLSGSFMQAAPLSQQGEHSRQHRLMDFLHGQGDFVLGAGDFPPA